MTDHIRSQPALPDPILSLILDEYARHGTHFIEGVKLDVYLAKLADRAEILSDSVEGRCRGFVAFYCNDDTTRRAFITLVLVNPRDRGLGIGNALVGCVLDIAKRRKFTSCQLEVSKHNEPAYAIYRSRGFRTVEDRATKDLLEVTF